MQIIQETPNTRFQQAWKYVDQNYAYLIHDSLLKSVTLQDEANHMPGADGLHKWHGDHAEITVRNGTSYSVPRFVEILVHELTHLAQCSSGRYRSMTVEQMEREAYPAGQNARSLYELRDLEALANEMKKANIAAAQQQWQRGR